MKNFCYIVVPGNSPASAIGAVVFGEEGYYKTTYDHCTSVAECRALVDHINERLGINREIEGAMLIGSMVGWSAPGAKAARLHFETANSAEKGGV